MNRFVFCNRCARVASMLSMLRRILLLPFVLLTFVCEEAPTDPATGSQKIIVAVSVLPQRFLVEGIGGDGVQVIVMVPPGMSPHSFEPPPSRVRDLERAALYVRTGVEFEGAWMERFRSVNPDMIVFDARGAVDDALIYDHEHGDHGEDHHHDTAGSNPHIWLDPSLVSRQAEALCEILIGLAPGDADAFRRRTREFQQELAGLDRRLRERLQPVAGRSVIVFHPSWSYFARAYGLETIVIEENGREPGPKHLMEVVRRGKALGLRRVIVQPEMSERTAQVVAGELGGDVLLVSPLKMQSYTEGMSGIAGVFLESLTGP